MTINHRKLQTSQILDKMIVNVNIINHIKKKKNIYLKMLFAKRFYFSITIGEKSAKFGTFQWKIVTYLQNQIAKKLHILKKSTEKTKQKKKNILGWVAKTEIFSGFRRIIYENTLQI